MAPLSEEAIKALELMPVGLLPTEIGGDEVHLETIKYTTASLRKLGYPGYYISGNGGVEEAIPHAMHTEAVINELDSISNVERAMAFKKSCAGTALKYANVALRSCRVGMSNTDQNNADPTAERKTFHDFVVEYCLCYGHTEDRYNQQQGIQFLRKPVDVKVQRWVTVLKDKNDCLPYLQGTGEVYNDDEMRRIFFKSMPMKWQDEFTSNGNNDISTATFEVLFNFMKQQEASAKTKSAVNRAKQATEKSGAKRKPGDSDSGNGSHNHARSKKKQRQNDKRNKFSSNNREKADSKDDGQCTRCVHKHLWKNCLYNPANPKNILGKLAAKAKKNGDKESDHQHHVDLVDSDDENTTGFLDPKPKAAKKG